MSIPVISFFNNKGGVGKTSMVYHLAWMLSELGYRVTAVDLDPQSNLTAAFLTEEDLEALDDQQQTIFGAVKPLKDGTSDILPPRTVPLSERLSLVAGDMALSTFEDELSESWPKTLESNPRDFRVMSAFWRVAQLAGAANQADVIVFDLGPNLGAINRAALIASDDVVIPLGPDLFSLQGLKNLGPAFRRWREGWGKRLSESPPAEIELPIGSIRAIGYLVLRHSIRLDRPVKAFDRWIARIPSTYRESVLGEAPDDSVTIDNDPHCIAKLKDYRSLMPLAQEARKPMFALKPADGALGAHLYAVQRVYEDFEMVAKAIAERANLSRSTNADEGVS